MTLPSIPLLKRFIREYIVGFRRQIVAAVGLMLLVAFTTAGLAWMMQPVLDDIFVNKREELLLPIAGAIILLEVIKGLSTYGHSLIMRRIANTTVSEMQKDLFAHMLQADIALFTQHASGTLITRFTNDIDIIRQRIMQLLVGLVKEPLTLLFLVAVMFYQDWALALIAFLVFPLAIYPMVRLGNRIRKLARQAQESIGGYTAVLDDIFQGIRIVKAYNSEARERAYSGRAIEQMRQIYLKMSKVDAASSPIMETLAGLIIGLVIWYGGMKVFSGETTPGAFFSFITALIMAYKPLKTISSLNNQLQSTISVLTRYYDMREQKAQVTDLPGAPALSLNNPGLHFDKVSFSYIEGEPVLNGITLKVPAGKRAALVGASGSGKSTIMHLLLRFYDPTSGQILVGGQDIKAHSLSSLRGAIALVTQDTTLFDASVADNIAYGMNDATREQIIAAAKDAAADDFISQLPEGYDTRIGQRGVLLSGGQRQRIAIARAMLRNAPILLLDEATSSLDTVSEQKIQDALHRLMQGRTSLVIAHRLSTILDADIIYVLDKGHVVESGKHQELLELRGHYYHLYSQQFRASPAALAS